MKLDKSCIKLCSSLHEHNMMEWENIFFGFNTPSNQNSSSRMSLLDCDFSIELVLIFKKKKICKATSSLLHSFHRGELVDFTLEIFMRHREKKLYSTRVLCFNPLSPRQERGKQESETWDIQGSHDCLWVGILLPAALKWLGVRHSFGTFRLFYFVKHPDRSVNYFFSVFPHPPSY